MTCPHLKDVTIPLCTAHIHAVEILAPDQTTLSDYCRSFQYPRCERHVSSLVHEEITRVFG